MKRGAGRTGDQPPLKKRKIVNLKTAMREVGRGDYADFRSILNTKHSDTYILQFPEKFSKENRNAFLLNFAEAIQGTAVTELVVENQGTIVPDEEIFINSLATTRITSITYLVSNLDQEKALLKLSKHSKQLTRLRLTGGSHQLKASDLNKIIDSKLTTLSCELRFNDSEDPINLANKLKHSSMISFELCSAKPMIEIPMLLNIFWNLMPEHIELVDNPIIILVENLKGSKLEHLSIPHWDLSIREAITLLTALRHTKITQLKFSLEMPYIYSHRHVTNCESEKNIHQFIQAIKESTLTNLSFACPFTAKDTIHLMEELKNSTVKELDLRRSFYEDDSTIGIDIAPCIIESNYTSLGLNRWMFDAEMATNFAQQLPRSNLTTLKLNQCNINFTIAKILFDGIKKSKIQYLSIDDNILCTNELQANALVNILQESSVTRLSAKNTVAKIPCLAFANPNILQKYVATSNVHRTNVTEDNPELSCVLGEKRWTSTLVPYYLHQITKDCTGKSCLDMRDIVSACNNKTLAKQREQEILFSMKIFAALGKEGLRECQTLIFSFLSAMSLEHTAKFIPKATISNSEDAKRREEEAKQIVEEAHKVAERAQALVIKAEGNLQEITETFQKDVRKTFMTF